LQCIAEASINAVAGAEYAGDNVVLSLEHKLDSIGNKISHVGLL